MITHTTGQMIRVSTLFLAVIFCKYLMLFGAKGAAINLNLATAP